MDSLIPASTERRPTTPPEETSEDSSEDTSEDTSEGAPTEGTVETCDVCMQDVEPSYSSEQNCGCTYCDDCLNQTFRVACANMASFPPKCCRQPLRLSDLGDFLDPDVVEKYKAVEEEFSANRPVYCAAPQCSTFIPMENMMEDGFGFCEVCGNLTCGQCRNIYFDHDLITAQNGGVTIMSICPADDYFLEALKELASRKKWKQCPTCSTMVERNEGCRRMDCVCGSEFCYRCGGRIDEKEQCRCPQGPFAEYPDEDDEDEDGDDDGDDEVFWWLQTIGQWTMGIP